MALPRFTMRRLLWLFTVLTVLIATLVEIEKTRVKKNHDIEVNLYRLNREAIESRREGMSTDYYERKTLELDADARRLGIGE